MRALVQAVDVFVECSCGVSWTEHTLTMADRDEQEAQCPACYRQFLLYTTVTLAITEARHD